MTGSELDRLFVDSKLVEAQFFAFLDAPVAAVEKFREVADALRPARSSVPDGDFGIRGSLLMEARSNFFLNYVIELHKESSHLHVMFDFVRRPASDPPKSMAAQLRKGRSVEWLMKEMSSLVEQGRKIRFVIKSTVQFPKFVPEFLLRMPTAEAEGVQFRCNAVEYKVASPSPEGGLVSFQINDEISDAGHSSVIATYERVDDNFGRVEAEQEQEQAFRYIRSIFSR